MLRGEEKQAEMWEEPGSSPGVPHTLLELLRTAALFRVCHFQEMELREYTLCLLSVLSLPSPSLLPPPRLCLVFSFYLQDNVLEFPSVSVLKAPFSFYERVIYKKEPVSLGDTFQGS